MNKAELVESVRRELGRDVSRVEAARAVRAVLEAIGTGLRRDRSVQIVGFGTFKAITNHPREGANPATGEHFAAAPTTPGVRFSAGKRLRNRL